MFGIGFEKWFVLIVVALFVVGPERLPEAAAWIGRTTRRVKEIAQGASQQLREDCGDDLDALREPLRQLHHLRDPRSALLRYVLDTDTPTTSPPPRSGSPSDLA